MKDDIEEGMKHIYTRAISTLRYWDNVGIQTKSYSSAKSDATQFRAHLRILRSA